MTAGLRAVFHACFAIASIFSNRISPVAFFDLTYPGISNPSASVPSLATVSIKTEPNKFSSKKGAEIETTEFIKNLLSTESNSSSATFPVATIFKIKSKLASLTGASGSINFVSTNNKSPVLLCVS